MPNDAPTTILVTGATGTQGGAVVDALLAAEADYAIHGLTRNPASDQARALAERGVTMVQGDLNEIDTLRPLVADVDAVFCVTDFWTAGYEQQVQQGKNVADAAAEAGVRHVVFSGVGSHDRNTDIPHFDSAWEIDQYLQQRGLPVTVLKPVFFMQNLEGMRDQILDGTLALALKEGVSLQMIDAADIGRAAERAFADPDTFIGTRHDLAGDELTLTEAAGIFSDVTGVQVTPVHVPVEQLREQMGDEFADMFVWFNDVGYEADVDALETTFGFRFACLKEYLREHGWASS